jgi:hypothetical protein
MASPVDTLRLLRLFRSAPPPLVETDLERRAVYSATSEQFEQLLSASATVGFAARPLTPVLRAQPGSARHRSRRRV